MKKMFFVVIAAFAALFSFGFCDAPVFAQLTVTEVSNANILGEDWFELTRSRGPNDNRCFLARPKGVSC